MSTSEAQAASSTTISVSPLFDDPLADVVLQSSDGVQYRLRRVFLVAASRFFDDLFTVAGGKTNPSSLEQELPVVPVEETSADLDLFVPFLCRESVLPDLSFEQIRTVLRIADK